MFWNLGKVLATGVLISRGGTGEGVKTQVLGK